MAEPLTELRRALVAKIAAGMAGVRVDLDPRALNPPCILVGVPTALTVTNRCVLAATVPVFLIAPPPAAGSAVDWLTDGVWRLLDVLDARTATAVDFQTADGQAPMPAYQVEVSASITTQEVP